MLKKLIWYYNRFKLMSLKEILNHRVPQLLQTQFLGRIQSSRPPRILGLNGEFMAPEYSLARIQSLFNKAQFTSEYQFFNVNVDILNVDDWRADLKNGITSPITYYGTIKRQDFRNFGDIKIVSELSRFHFAPFLAFKHVCDIQAGYRDKIEQILFDWMDQNPYLKSVHWTSGIEVGIRSVNLVYTHMVLKWFNALTPAIENSLLSLLSYNYQFLKNHLSLYSSANNHLMAELMGLVVISSYCNVSLSNKQKWIGILYDQVHAQVNEDGVHMELCTRYHAEVLDQILIAVLFLRATGNEVPAHIEKRLKSMCRFLEHVDYHGYSTEFGDSDEGFVINPFFQKSFSLYSSQLMSCNHLFGTCYGNNGVVDFRNYLLFGDVFQICKSDQLPTDSFFDSSGYCFMYDHDHGIKVSFDVGEIGDSISAAHGHSDLLHFTLQQYGSPIIVDTGTFQYHSDQIFWRNYFRGIHAHNTISVNGTNHAKINNRMSWISKPAPPISSTNFSKDISICQAEHKAFEELGVVHHRSIELNRSQQTIQITDILKKKIEIGQRGSFSLHFHPRAIVKHEGKSIKVKLNNQELILENDNFTEGKLVIGDEKEPLGWFSSQFDRMEKSCCFRMDFMIENGIQLVTRFGYS